MNWIPAGISFFISVNKGTLINDKPHELIRSKYCTGLDFLSVLLGSALIFAQILLLNPIYVYRKCPHSTFFGFGKSLNSVKLNMINALIYCSYRLENCESGHSITLNWLATCGNLENSKFNLALYLYHFHT